MVPSHNISASWSTLQMQYFIVVMQKMWPPIYKQQDPRNTSEINDYIIKQQMMDIWNKTEKAENTQHVM